MGEQTAQGEQQVVVKPWTEAEIQEKFAAIRVELQKIADMVESYVGPMGRAVPALGTYKYEAHRRLEEAMHRISDCTAILMMYTPENQERITEEAVRTGKHLKIVGAPAPAVEEKK